MDGDSKFGWANLIALCLFVAGYFVKWCLDAWEQRRRRLNFYRAIATEIRLNVDALDRAVSSLPPTSTFRAFVGADPENRPHIISTYMCSIYQSNTGELNQLPQIVTRNIIEFYGMLEFLGEYVRSFDRRSFATISMRSREASVEMLVAKIAEAQTMGRALHDLIRRELGI